MVPIGVSTYQVSGKSIALFLIPDPEHMDRLTYGADSKIPLHKETKGNNYQHICVHWIHNVNEGHICLMIKLCIHIMLVGGLY